MEAKEWIIRLCSKGCIAIDLLGREMLESRAGETENDAWQRMKGRLASGRQLEETTLREPGTNVSSGGAAPITPVFPPENPDIVLPLGNPAPGVEQPGSGLFGGSTEGIKERTRLNAPSTSSLTLLGKLEGWGIKPGSQVYGCKLSVDKLTGAQLQDLLKKLPDGITYSLDLEKE